jgi:hypothetical protein
MRECLGCVVRCFIHVLQEEISDLRHVTTKHHPIPFDIDNTIGEERQHIMDFVVVHALPHIK